MKEEKSLPTLGEFIIEKQRDFKYSTGELSRLISCIQIASKMVNRAINKAGIITAYQLYPDCFEDGK